MRLLSHFFTTALALGDGVNVLHLVVPSTSKPSIKFYCFSVLCLSGLLHRGGIVQADRRYRSNVMLSIFSPRKISSDTESNFSWIDRTYKAPSSFPPSCRSRSAFQVFHFHLTRAPSVSPGGGAVLGFVSDIL